MGDPFSTAASGIAVISLVIQLVDSTNKVYEFWKSVEESPASIRGITADLHLLGSVLEAMKRRENREGLDYVSGSVLESCMDKIETIFGITKKLEMKLSATSKGKRKWAAVRAVMKDSQIQKLKDSLAETKQTLLLARMLELDQQAVYHFESNQQMIESVRRQVSGLEFESRKSTPLQHRMPPYSIGNNSQIERLQFEASQAAKGMSNPVLRRGFEQCMAMAIKELAGGLSEDDSRSSSTSNDLDPTESPKDASSINQSPLQIKKWKRKKQYISGSEKRTNNFFGSVRFCRERTRTISATDSAEPLEKEEDTITFKMTPAPWLVRLGVRTQILFYVSNSTTGFTNSISTFRIIPSDSLVFDLCKEGNVEMVKKLFDRKDASAASPWDMNEKGQTLLDVASENLQPDVCQMLWATMKETAFWQDFWWEGMELATDDFEKGISADKYKSILGLYLKTADLEDPCDYSWNILAKLGAQHSRIASLSSRDADLIHDLYVWMLDIMRPGLAHTVSDHCILMTLDNARDATERVGLQFFDFILDVCNNRLDVKECDTWYAMLHHSIMNQDFKVTSLLVQRGADTHLTGFYNFTSPVEETPTSLALYTSEDFKNWKEVLIANNVDIATFVKDEIFQDPLKLDGWNEDTLLQVFELNPDSRVDGWRQSCANTNRCPRCADSDYAGMQLIVDVPWQKLLDTIKRPQRREDDEGRGKTARVDAVAGFYKYPGIPLGHLTCYYNRRKKAIKHSFVSEGAQPPLGRPIAEYEWVCLKCWYEVKTLHKRIARSKEIVEDGLTAVAGDEDDYDSSPFLLQI